MKQKALFPKRTVYYLSERDDFMSLEENRELKIDRSYRYDRSSLFQRIGDFIAYRLIAAPCAFLYTKLKFSEHFIGKKKLRAYRNVGYFIYSNHTQPIADAFSPNILSFSKKNSVIINKQNLFLPVLGRHLKRLGALPLPEDLRAARSFTQEVEARIRRGEAITVYPEAHIWEYYTGVRDFPVSCLELPVRCSAPVFTATRIYKQKGRRVVCDIYIDGPFSPDTSLSKREAQAKLKNEVYNAMLERSKLSSVDVIKYVKRTDSEHFSD